MNLSQIECLNFLTEVHFVLLHMEDGITPGTLVYTYADENEQSVSHAVSPSRHTGNVWHYNDYPFTNRFINVTSATVNVNGVLVTRHNPGEYAGTYNFAATATATPTATPINTSSNIPTLTFTPTFTSSPTATDTMAPTPTFTETPTPTATPTESPTATLAS